MKFATDLLQTGIFEDVTDKPRTSTKSQNLRHLYPLSPCRFHQ